MDIKEVIEALLFATKDPLSIDQLYHILKKKLSVTKKRVREELEALQQEYTKQSRAFQIEEIAQGFLISTKEKFAPFLEPLFADKRKQRLSQAAKEVLAIIAYKQPITRPQIEKIRGVDCSSHIQHLVERELIKAVGQLEVPGRPILWGTTNAFLKHFGLHSIEELKTQI